jgi:HEAT repeat protein
MVSKQQKANRKPANLTETLQVLKESEGSTINAKVFYGLSGLSEADIEQVKPVWAGLNTEYRQKLVQRVADISETNFDLDYRAFGLFALEDEDAEVRKSAIAILEVEDSLVVMRRLIEVAQWDENTLVRAAAISDLGRFILLGEYEELPEREIAPVQDLLIGFWTDESEDLEVRRRALEAISNSSHEIVEEAIEEAYNSDERLMRVSSLFAMGRSCDEQWEEIILKELGSPDPEIRYEAARASGELTLTNATAQLSRLAQGNDREIKEVAIWSLGEIGGREALRVLSALAGEAQDADDEELVDLIDEAIGNAALIGSDLPLSFDPSNN